jgi:hypothetical protein
VTQVVAPKGKPSLDLYCIAHKTESIAFQLCRGCGSDTLRPYVEEHGLIWHVKDGLKDQAVWSGQCDVRRSESDQ